MKVYLDDERETPRGWVRTYTPAQTIELLSTEKVEELSLDHDLGDDINIGTGYHVLIWLEEQAFNDLNFTIPKIHIHSANSSARLKMLQAVNSIERIRQAKLDSHNQ